MGNSTSKPPKGGKGNAKHIKNKTTHLDSLEIGLLDQIFHEMAVRSPNDTISKDTFLKFFDLPGVLGDRLFQVFDTKKTGEIDFEEFLQGYHKFARTDPKSKMEMLFQLFDLDDAGGITEDELRTVLLSIVTPPNQVMQNGGVPTFTHRKSNLIKAPLLDASSSNQSLKYTPRNKSNSLVSKAPAYQPPSSPLPTDDDNTDSPKLRPTSPNQLLAPNSTRSPNLSSSQLEQPTLDSLASVTSLHHPGLGLQNEDDDVEQPINIDEVQYEVNKIVDQAFKECDLDQSGRLDPSEFKQFIKKNPKIIEMCEELFVQLAWNGPQKDTIKQDFNMIKAEYGSARYDLHGFPSLLYGDHNFIQCEEKECHMRFVTRRELIPPPPEEKDPNDEDWNYVILAHGGDEFFRFDFCPSCGKRLTRPNSRSVANNPPVIAAVSQQSIGPNEFNNYMEGKLKVADGRLKMLKSRWVVLNGKFLYVFKKQDKQFPDTVLFVQGYFIQLRHNDHHHQHLIRLVPPSGSESRTANFYTGDEEAAKKWVDSLEISAQTISIDKFYEMGTQLGKGSFAEVRKAKEKETKRQVAVKIIQKKVIDGKQKEYIRIEMSVMKLVNHPNVMRLEQVFETKTKIYMVMPLYTGGDLYEYMKHNARKGLPEDQVRQIIYQVIHALRYLHSVGIVHRDLKPENLLLKKAGDPTDCVITDFGLSKFAAPHEAMKAACGTLSYVAPEVLKMNGYGKEVDLWSTGVIMFLLFRAKLPFYDNTKNKIIARILRQKPQMVDEKWSKISTEGKDLIKQLLIKNPDDRITCNVALKHPFFEPIRLEIERRKRPTATPNALMNIPILEEHIEDSQSSGVFPTERSIKDIKYGDIDGQTLHQGQAQFRSEKTPEPITIKPSPAQLMKQTSIRNGNKYTANDFDDDDDLVDENYQD